MADQPHGARVPAGSGVRNFLFAVGAVALVLIGGAIWDRLSRARHQVECERAGGVYVLGLSDFVCATAQQVRL